MTTVFTAIVAAAAAVARTTCYYRSLPDLRDPQDTVGPKQCWRLRNVNRADPVFAEFNPVLARAHASRGFFCSF